MHTNPSTIRFANLVSEFGPVVPAHTLSRADWTRARDEKRFLTVYPDGRDSRVPAVGLVAHEGVGRALCRLVFSRPLPESVFQVIGLRDSQAAVSIVHA